MKAKVIITIVVVFLAVCSLGYYLYYKNEQNRKQKEDTIAKIGSHYNDYVITNKDVNLYDKSGNVIGIISNMEVTLDKQVIDENTKYFYIGSLDAYIKYEDVEKIESLTPFDKYYENYIPFNNEVTLTEDAIIYIDEDTYFKFNRNDIKFNPIIIDGDKYYFEYNDRLVYVLKDSIKEETFIEKTVNTASSIAVLNYHYVVNREAGELNECVQSICITDTQYDEEMKYLSDNGYYTATMRDTELFLQGKINLPEKSVVITIDDGWYVGRNIEILQKYKLHATLFLIGSLASPEAYKSDYLEIHSHGWNIHNIGECSGGNLGGALLCKDRQYLLDDLKKSRESLNNTPYFCYPLYDYNDYAISILKEAGFTMAFKGGRYKATPGIDLFKVPRYSITNTDTLYDFISYIS